MRQLILCFCVLSAICLTTSAQDVATAASVQAVDITTPVIAGEGVAAAAVGSSTASEAPTAAPAVATAAIPSGQAVLTTGGSVDPLISEAAPTSIVLQPTPGQEPTAESAASAAAAAEAAGIAADAAAAAAAPQAVAAEVDPTLTPDAAAARKERRRGRRTGPPSTTAVVSASALPVIPYNNQCGGQSPTVVNGRPGCVPGSTNKPCKDAAWPGVTCQPGTVCVRDNQWWWFCNYGAPAPPTPPAPTTVTVPTWAQCGGRSTTPTNGLPGCGTTNPLRQCIDAPWSGVLCPAGDKCVRSNEWWWNCAPSTVPPPATPPAPPGPVPPATSTGCPAGWLPAVGTVYDSWPKPGSKECVENSGCVYAGQFSEPSITAGPSTCTNSNQCATYTDWRGIVNKAQCLNGGSGQVACRWPESNVQLWKMAATWVQDTGGLLGKSIQVMVEGNTARTATVRVMDTCDDKDCGNCCSRNTANGKWRLLDLEKWSALDLLGTFNPNVANFDINSVATPAAGSKRPGAEGQMPLCYRVI